MKVSSIKILYLFRKGRHLKKGSLSNVNSMGDCDGATQYARQRSFPVTTFDLVPRETYNPYSCGYS